MLDIAVLLCIYLYSKIQTGITSIIDSYTQDACKRNEVQRMPFVLRCIALLNIYVSFFFNSWFRAS